MTIVWIRTGALLMLAAVAAGAFGAHALKDRFGAYEQGIWETAVRYQAYHALALFIVAWLETRSVSKAVPAAGWFFIAGSLIFSGSLYALALTGQKKLGAVTPIGGLAFLIGWALLLFSSHAPRAGAKLLNLF